MSDSTCNYCKKGVGSSVVSCNVCNAEYHRSCAERCQTDDPRVLKCCKDSRPTSPSPTVNTGLNIPASNSASAGKSNKSPSSSDVSKLSAYIKVLSEVIAKGFSESKASSKQFCEQMNNRMQGIEDKLVVLDTVQASLGKLTTRVDELESKVPDPISNAINCAQEGKEQIVRAGNLILYGIVEPTPYNLQNDLQNIRQCFAAFQCIDTDSLTFHRIGKPSEASTHPRPTIVKLKSSHEVLKILRHKAL